MSVLIIGGDKLGNIPEFLENKGVNEYIHWDGRKKGMRKMEIPKKIDMVIIFHDFIEHRLSEKIKKVAREKNLPCIFCRRSISDLSIQFDRCINCKYFV